MDHFGCSFDELSEGDRRFRRWLDPSLDWVDRVSMYRRYLQEQACAYVNDAQMTPVILWEDAARQLEATIMPQDGKDADKEKLQDFHIQELQASLASMTGILFGTNGSGGAIQRIEDKQEKVFQELEKTNQNLNKIMVMHTKQFATLNAKVDQNTKDINGVGDLARSVSNRVENRAERFLESLKKATLPILISGVFVLLIWGVQFWIQGGM